MPPSSSYAGKRSAVARAAGAAPQAASYVLNAIAARMDAPWRALRRIPAGHTMSYGALARALGVGAAARAADADDSGGIATSTMRILNRAAVSRASGVTKAPGVVTTSTP